MNEYNLKEIERKRKKWNKRANTYDKFYDTFRGAVENYIDWELLNHYLPKSKNIEILDAAGGTGRISIPLAKSGYKSITLCDISPNMLEIVRQKKLKEGIHDNLRILECNVSDLHFEDDFFDFVLCWDGMVDKLVIKELIRVTKKEGLISIYLNNKWAFAFKNFFKNPNNILKLIESKPNLIENQERSYKNFSIEEARIFFEKEGVKVLNIYAVCHWLRFLNIPEKILRANHWNEEFFSQTVNMVRKLSEEPSVQGLSKHLVLYGQKM
ncbi:MAG: class I SAM-dependent methyltransferase [Candidatus Thorarchaeota archaeon]